MTTPDQVLVGSYNYQLVALSVLVSMLAAWAALDLAGRVTAAQGGIRLAWLLAGSTASGIGTWSMHLYRNAGLQLAGSGAVRLAHGSPISPASYFSLLRWHYMSSAAAKLNCFVHSPPAYRWAGGIAGMHYVAMEGNAAAGHVPLFSAPRDPFGDPRDSIFSVGVMADISFSARAHRSAVEKGFKRTARWARPTPSCIIPGWPLPVSRGLSKLLTYPTP
jgi:hypothetical protein